MLINTSFRYEDSDGEGGAVASAGSDEDEDEEEEELEEEDEEVQGMRHFTPTHPLQPKALSPHTSHPLSTILSHLHPPTVLSTNTHPNRSRTTNQKAQNGPCIRRRPARRRRRSLGRP